MKRTPMTAVASIAFAALTAGAASADFRFPTSTDEARAAFAERQASAPAPAGPCVSSRTPTSTDEARAMAAAKLDASPEVASPAPPRARQRPPTSTDEARALAESRTSTRHLPESVPPELPICRR